MSTAIVAIDPGFNGTGIAVLTNGELVSTALIKPCGPEVEFAKRLRAYAETLAAIDFPTAPEFVIEFPDRNDQKGDITDLFKLAALTGAISYVVPWAPVYVFPSEWKGNVPKELHNQRVLSGLTEKELARFMASGYSADTSHNVIDAIGLAKWRLSNPQFVSRFGTSAQNLRSRIRRVKALGKF